MTGVIERVHPLPSGMRPVDVVAVDDDRQEGTFWIEERLIEIGGRAPAPDLAIAHELGHYFDVFHVGEGSVATDNIDAHPALAEWWAAVRGSDRWQQQVAVANDDSADDTVRGWAAYLATPREAFGYSYSQWLAERSGDALLTAQMERERSLPGVVAHWDDEDFQPIARAMDKLLLGGSQA